MKIDYDYLKDDLFPLFLADDIIEIPYPTGFEKLRRSKGSRIFDFHFGLLEDKGYVTSRDSASKETRVGTLPHTARLVARLTFDGQEFAENLTAAKPEWLDKIKGQGLNVASDVLKNLITTYLTSSPS